MARFSSATGIWVLTLLLFGSFGAGAQTRTENLRWQHPDPTNTAGYKIYYGTTSRTYTKEVNVGAVTSSAGIYYASVQVPATGSIYFAVTAYDSKSNESNFSNEIVRTASSGGGGGTTPPPPPSGSNAAAAITVLRLRNAVTQSVIDSDFRSGDQIDVASQGCTTIEIVGNTYLSKVNQPGSVQTVFDGSASACNNAPITHENNPPYSWERENTCAPSLTKLGQHSLKVIPYDGDDCKGEVGTPVTVNFEVLDSSVGSGTTVGRPGQPVLIQ